MKKGKLIVFEGTDGSGKATQVKLLSEKVKIPHEVISFPRYGNNLHAEQARIFLRGKKTKISPKKIALDYAGDRKLAKSQIEKWLKDGRVVIADRYVSSSKAHLGALLQEFERAEFIDWLDEMEYATNKVPREDLTIFLYVPPEISQKNIIGRGKDILEKDLKYQKIASQVYLDLAKSQNWITIFCVKDGKMRSKEEISREIFDILSPHL